MPNAQCPMAGKVGRMASVNPGASLPAPPPGPRGRPLLAWLVILGLVAFILVRFWRQPPADNRAVRAVTVLMQARYLVGVAHLNLPGVTADELYRQTRRQLDQGPFVQRV